MGMAHRGRLNVLANIFIENQLKIFSQNLTVKMQEYFDGDVKYHLGLH
jgi:2-oxoglutarate dehydrogenase E1 component